MTQPEPYDHINRAQRDRLVKTLDLALTWLGDGGPTGKGSDAVELVHQVRDTLAGCWPNRGGPQ